jgi:hypothetical protein
MGMVAANTQSLSKSPPRLKSVRGVEIFAAGTYRGRRYTVPELDQIVRNFYRLGPRGLKLLNPPAVIGHEETQEFLERTDLPAAGWLRNLRRRGDILVGDFAEVPASVANLIDSRAYRKVSAEIYDDFKDDFENGYGMAIRRIALLGGEIPQVKRLEDIPHTSFSESRATRHLSLKRSKVVTSKSLKCVMVFSELVPMNRDQLVAAVKAAMPNLDQATIDQMTDEMLQALVNNLPGGAAPAAPMATMADMPREDLISELTALGQDPATLEPMTDDQLQQMYDELTETEEIEPAAAPMADGETPPMTREEMIAALVAQGQDPAALQSKTDDELKAMLQPAAPMSDANKPKPKPVALRTAARPAVSVNAFAEKTLRESKRLLATVRKEQAKVEAEKKKVKKEQVQAFCERLVSEGRLTPAMRETFEFQLLHADDQRVQRFSENGKAVETTEFERLKRQFASMPKLVHFGEKIKGNGSSSDETEVAAVRRFAEVQADALKKAGKSPEAYVAKFSELRKKDPTLTAAKFGVPAEYRV